jgi:two-component sensor histidine kinase
VKRLIVFGWPLAGIGITAFDALVRQAFGAPVPLEDIFWGCVGWSLWAPLTPVMVWLARAFPYRPAILGRYLLLHACAAFAVSAVHGTIFYALRVAVRGEAGMPGQSAREVLLDWLPWHVTFDVLIYGGTVLATQVALFLEAAKRRENERFELEHWLAQAQLDVFKLQLPPGVIDERLLEIERAIEHDVADAELLIERFGESLRESLAAVDTAAATDEIAHDESEMAGPPPPPLSLPVRLLLLFGIVPVIQLFINIVFGIPALILGQQMPWYRFRHGIEYAVSSFPLTVAMVWLGTRVQRVWLLVVAAAVVPFLWQFGWEALSIGVAEAQATVLRVNRPTNFLVGLGMALCALVYTRYRAWHAKAEEVAQLESQVLRTRATILRLQLNPHFLFNALNSVAALLEDDPAGARKMAAQLRQFVGRVLANSHREDVPLGEELDSLATYVAIENVRFGGRVALDVDADGDARGTLVPGFLLQPLVENALRHGLEPETGGRVAVRAAVAEGRLHITIADNGRSEEVDEPMREGIGLSNTRARLAQRYGDAFTLDLAASTEGFLVDLQLPCR